MRVEWCNGSQTILHGFGFNTLEPVHSIHTLAEGDVQKPRFPINVRCTVRGRGAYLLAAETFSLWFQQRGSNSRLQFGYRTVPFHVIGNTDAEC